MTGSTRAALALWAGLGASLAGGGPRPAPAQTPADVTAARALVGQAASALRGDDPAVARSLLGRAAALRPGHPSILYDLAGTHALLGDTAAALAALDLLAGMGIAVDPAEDEAFSAVRGPAFDALRARLLENARPVVASVEAFRLDDAEFIPEGIANDPASGRFFVGSVHRRRIVSVGADGRVSDFPGAGGDRLWSVLGMAVDPPRRRLWVTTSALPETPGLAPGELGSAALLEFDLDRDELRARYPAGGSARHALGDLAVGPGGEVYVSDGASGAVLRLAAGGSALETLVPPGHLASPQGLALSADGGRLYIADYSLGLLALDLGSGRLSHLPAPPGVTLLGIDGLVRADGDLVAIQNGIRPNRVLRLRLDAGGGAIGEARVVEASHPSFDQPTLGTLVDGALYYVANSQWDHFRDGVLQRDRPLYPPVILRLPLTAR